MNDDTLIDLDSIPMPDEEADDRFRQIVEKINERRSRNLAAVERADEDFRLRMHEARIEADNNLRAQVTRAERGYLGGNS
jgi:hypothetical protein